MAKKSKKDGGTSPKGASTKLPFKYKGVTTEGTPYGTMALGYPFAKPFLNDSRVSGMHPNGMLTHANNKLELADSLEKRNPKKAKQLREEAGEINSYIQTRPKMGVNKDGMPNYVDVDAISYGNGGLLPNEYGLPEYGFGSWLKDNGAGLLKGAGSLVSMIPGIGTIAGPILSTAGSVIGKVQGDNAAVDAEQAALDEQAAVQKEQQDVADRATRSTNIVDQKEVNYGGTFENGGPIGQGFMGQPQITEYTNGQKHGESATRGIPVDARGNPATTSKSSAVGLTEKGEVTWNGYVFSDKLKS